MNINDFLDYFSYINEKCFYFQTLHSVSDYLYQTCLTQNVSYHVEDNYYESFIKS